MANSEAPRATKRRDSMNVVPVVVALLAVGLFLGWLATRQPSETVAVAEPNAPNGAVPAEAPTGPATTIEPAALNQSEQLVGQVVEIPSINVQAALGPQMFWAELPGGQPYLVKLDETLVQQGIARPTSGRVRVVGQVQSITPAVLEDWMQRGVLTSADERLQAEFSSTYIQATRVVPAGQ
jgi:hypothetical protein